jgi:predicted ester cyclase
VILEDAMDPRKETFVRVVEAISTGDTDALDTLVDRDVIDHNPMPGQAAGLHGFKEWVRAARVAFPELRGTVEDVLADEDRVAGRVLYRWTQHANPGGVPATDREITFTAFNILRLRDGKIVEWWGVAAVFGAIRPPGTSG